jgi:hypothetical protein
MEATQGTQAPSESETGSWVLCYQALQAPRAKSREQALVFFYAKPKTIRYNTATKPRALPPAPIAGPRHIH